MKNAKHTPGPWKVKRTRDVWPESKSAGVIIVKERGSYEWKGEEKEVFTHICYIPDNPRAQFLKNANLLATSPEMLEALRRFQLSFSSLVNSTDLPPGAEAIVRNFMQQAFEYSLRVTQKADGEE